MKWTELLDDSMDSWLMIHDPPLYSLFKKELAEEKDLVCKIEAKAFKLTYCLAFLLIFLRTVS